MQDTDSVQNKRECLIYVSDRLSFNSDRLCLVNSVFRIQVRFFSFFFSLSLSFSDFSEFVDEVSQKMFTKGDALPTIFPFEVTIHTLPHLKSNWVSMRSCHFPFKMHSVGFCKFKSPLLT